MAMRGGQKLALALLLAALLAAALLAAALSACGGDSDDSSSGSTAASVPSTTTEGQAAGGTDREQQDDGAGSGNGDSGGGSSGDGGGDDEGSSADEPSASFRTPGGDNSIQNYGDEADMAEREAAATVLAAYLDARAAGDWAGQCRYLSKITRVPMEQYAERSPQTKGKGCAAALEALTGNAASANSPSTLTGPIASLRVEGVNGFVLYHGAGGVDYFVPMVKEGGAWKLGALAPSEFP